MQANRNSMFLYIVVVAVIVMIARSVLMHSGQTVVASTSLTGAIAQAAGAHEVRIVAGPDVKDPPDYDLSPGDIAQLNGASAVVYEGHEKMARRLIESSKGRGLPTLQVETGTSPDIFVDQARKIAVVFHTRKEEEAWEKDFLQRVAVLKSRLAPYSGKKAVVHVDAQGFAEWAGLTVVRVIKPGEMSPETIRDAAARKPDIVLDSLHTPLAKAVADTARCQYAPLIVFPGAGKTKTLEDILEYDAARIVEAFGPRS